MQLLVGSKVRSGLLFFAIGACPLVRGQSALAGPMSVAQIHYFASFFERVGSPDVPAAVDTVQERSVARIFDMDDAESAQLHAAAQEYRAEMAKLRSEETALVSGKSSLDASDRAALSSLIQARDRLVASAAQALLSSIRTATASRIMSDAGQTIRLRARIGVN